MQESENKEVTEEATPIKEADAPSGELAAPEVILCSVCNGKGRVSDTESCETCQGTGVAK